MNGAADTEQAARHEAFNEAYKILRDVEDEYYEQRSQVDLATTDGRLKGEAINEVLAALAVAKGRITDAEYPEMIGAER